MSIPLLLALTLSSVASSEAILTPAGTPLAQPLGATHGPAAVRGIDWQPSYETALELAKDENRLIFISLLADGEGRSTRLRKEGLKDRKVVKATADFVCLGASTGALVSDRTAAKSWGIKVEEHRRLYAALLEEIVAKNEEGVVALPQHLWLGSDGQVLLSVPYELSPEQFLWCFAEARAAADPGLAFAPPEGAWPPWRLMHGESWAPADGDERGRGLLPEELEPILRRMKGGRQRGGDGARSYYAVAFTDEDDAHSQINGTLSSGWLTYGRGELAIGAIHMIGVLSPQSWWDLTETMAKDRNARLRAEVAAALEQLAEPKSLKLINSLISKEEDPAVRKNLMRALGAAGRGDSRVRKTLLKACTSEDNPIVRINAIIALGHLEGDSSVRKFLEEGMQSEILEERLAALCAVALSRDASYIKAVEASKKGLKKELDIGTATHTLEVLKGANLSVIGGDIKRIARDEIERERIFFKALPSGTGQGRGEGEGEERGRGRGGRGGRDGGEGGDDGDGDGDGEGEGEDGGRRRRRGGGG